MKRVIRRTKQARDDIIDIYGYIAARNHSAAERVFDAIEQTIRFISEWPGCGTRWEAPHPKLEGIRMIGLQKYRNYLVFFRPTNDSVEILRVVQGAQLLERIVDEIELEFAEDKDA